MDINKVVNKLDSTSAKHSLSYLLSHFMTPAFGALPKAEVELIIFNVLGQIGAIESEPEVYELVSKLKITRTKARRLIYDNELRNSTEADLDNKVKQLLKAPLIQKNGELFVFEIDNPLVSDHLRAKIQKLGYVSDGSFSPSIVKLGLDAITVLTESFVAPENKKLLRAALIKAGAPNTSLKGIIKSVLKKLGKKLASETGEALFDKASDYILPIVNDGAIVVSERVKELFEDNKAKHE